LNISAGLTLFDSIKRGRTLTRDSVEDLKEVVENTNRGMPLDEALESSHSNIERLHAKRPMADLNAVKSGTSVKEVCQDNRVAHQGAEEEDTEYMQELNVLTMVYMLFESRYPDNNHGLVVLTSLNGHRITQDIYVL